MRTNTVSHCAPSAQALGILNSGIKCPVEGLITILCYSKAGARNQFSKFREETSVFTLFILSPTLQWVRTKLNNS